MFTTLRLVSLLELHCNQRLRTLSGSADLENKGPVAQAFACVPGTGLWREGT